MLMAVSPLPDEVGGFCVALGYVLFELLVLNDCCNIVKANDASLLRVMAAAGWPLRWECSWAGWRRLPAASLAGAAESVSSLVALGLFAALVSVSLVFTERDMISFAAVADDRALSEGALEGPTREEAFAALAEQQGLSRREAEVASYLLAGRTTSFAAEKLVHRRVHGAGPCAQHLPEVRRALPHGTDGCLRRMLDGRCRYVVPRPVKLSDVRSRTARSGR